MRLEARDIALFWSKVDIRGADECWPWLAGCTTPATGGHGTFWLRAEKRDTRAHRASWFIANGEIPEGMCVCHSCDNAPCCNPAHLWLGTQADNVRDMAAKGRGRPDPTWHGERVNFAKLGASDVVEIRSLRASGLKLKEIAARFGVCEATISLIASGKNWKHIPQLAEAA